MTDGRMKEGVSNRARCLERCHDVYEWYHTCKNVQQRAQQCANDSVSPFPIQFKAFK